MMLNIANLSLQGCIFYALAAVALVSALKVVIAKNAVHSVLFLILTFFATAGLWVLLNAEFLAVTLVLVYVGAVMVLFLFVIMMLDIEVTTLQTRFSRFWLVGLLWALLFAIGLIYALGPHYFGSNIIPIPEFREGLLEKLALSLYTDFLYPFEIAGILLLAAMIAAISLTFRGKKDRLATHTNDALKTVASERVRLVKMNSVGNRV